MSRDDYNLLRMFIPLDVSDDICAFDVGQHLRRENKMHSCRALANEIGNQIGVFGSDRRRWNFGNAVLVVRLASMRYSVLLSADRTNQTRDGAELGRRNRAVTSIDDGLAVGLAGVTLRSHLFVERMIKEDNFSAHFFRRQ